SRHALMRASRDPSSRRLSGVAGGRSDDNVRAVPLERGSGVPPEEVDMAARPGHDLEVAGNAVVALDERHRVVGVAPTERSWPAPGHARGVVVADRKSVV